MDNSLRLMAVLAHPDDESLGVGITMAKYAAQGVETTLVTATRGERGWTGAEEDFPGLAELGRIRTAELACAAQALNIHRVEFLDYIDGDLNQADPPEVISKLVCLVREVRPQVVLSFAPEGGYGHPDHIAISQLTAAALACAANPNYPAPCLEPFQVLKFYYFVVDTQRALDYTHAFGELTMDVDGGTRQGVAWPQWAINARISSFEHVPAVRQAIECHKSQIAAYGDLSRLTDADWAALGGENQFIRVYSLAGNSPAVEEDLFAGVIEESVR
jgi:LmbE family N-acetylglucosaminyl deacetylase